MLTREEALAIYHAGPETVVRVLLAMDARIHALEQQVQDLSVRLDASERRVKHLEDQLEQIAGVEELARLEPWGLDTLGIGIEHSLTAQAFELRVRLGHGGGSTGIDVL